MQTTNKSFLDEYLEKYPQINGNEVAVGMPATVGVVSDSYATHVTEVVRFKSGKRAGAINYIKVDRFDEKFYAKEVKPCWNHKDKELPNTCIYCYQYNLGVSDFKHKDWFSVSVGYAIDYRDPHR